MSLLSNSEIDYCRFGLTSGQRIDGRTPTDKREGLLSIGSLQHTPGSASITLDNTSVLVAVQAKISETPIPIQFLVDYAPSAKMIPTEMINSKCDLLQNLLTCAYGSSIQQIPFNTGLPTNNRYWHLNILNDAGNIYEASFQCISAALASTRLPASIEGGIYPEDLIPLPFATFPSLKYLIQIDDVLATDPTLEEETIADSQLFLTYTTESEISSIQKIGPGLISIEQIISILA